MIFMMKSKKIYEDDGTLEELKNKLGRGRAKRNVRRRYDRW